MTSSMVIFMSIMKKKVKIFKYYKTKYFLNLKKTHSMAGHLKDC